MIEHQSMTDDEFCIALKRYLSQGQLLLYFPDDIQSKVRADPRDSSGIWVDTCTWVDLRKLVPYIPDTPKETRH